MSEEVSRLKRKTHRVGTLDGYTMYGFQFEDEQGRLAWQISAWGSDGYNDTDVHDYWVTEGEFFHVTIHIAYQYTSNNLIQTHGPVTEIDAKEKSTILKKIAEWEREQRENSSNEGRSR